MGENEEERKWHSARPDVVEHILAHDLANYLTIIQGHTELLLSDVQDPDQADQLTTIKHQTTAATAMLQTVGGITRASTSTEFAGVDVHELVSSEADRLRSAYPRATISTAITDDIRVQADELLVSVFANLIENAIKHNTSVAPSVDVTATIEDAMAVIAVTDNGPGIPDEVCAQLEGRGLAPPQSGVHIVRYLVDQYGGTISVDTSSDGSTITVELPRLE